MKSASPRPRVGVLRYGVVPYGQALAHQHALRERVVSGDGDGWIVCLEHPPVVTLGKRGRPDDIIAPELLAERGVELFRVDRGGEATYHGPGQLVVYPIVRLDALGLGIVDVVRRLARSLADTLDEEGVDAEYDAEHPGLWTTEAPRRKIASVGMRVSRGVSTHGAALNLTTDLIPFSWIVACGMPNAPMTRLQDYVEEPVDLGAFRERFLEAFARSIEVELFAADVALPPRESWVPSLDVATEHTVGDSALDR